jgi:hypothetical protein
LVILDREEDLLTEVKTKYGWTTVKADLLDWEGTKTALAGIEVCHHIVNK